MDHQDAVRRFRKRRAERMNNKKPKRLDSVDEYRKRRDERLMSRLRADDDEEGRWVTTENNHKVHISEEGTPDKGNEHVLQKMNSASEREGSSTARKKWDTAMKRYTEVCALMEKRMTKEFKEKEKFIDSKRIDEMYSNAKSVYRGENYEEMHNKVKELEKSLNTMEDWDNYEKYANAMKFLKLFGDDALNKDLKEIKADVDRVRDYRLAGEETDLRKEMKKYVKDAFPKLTDCDSNTALELRVDAGDMFAEDEFGISKHTSLGKVDEETRMAVAGGVQKMFDKYPALVGKLQSFSVGWTLNEGSYAESSDAGVVLSERAFENKEYLKQHLKADEEMGFHPKGCTSIESVVIHEYGHQIDDFFQKHFSDDLGGRDFSEYVIERVSERMGATPMELKTMVSKYALQGRRDREFLAEAFSEYMCSDSPGQVASEVGRVVEEFAKRI